MPSKDEKIWTTKEINGKMVCFSIVVFLVANVLKRYCFPKTISNKILHYAVCKRILSKPDPTLKYFMHLYLEKCFFPCELPVLL